MKTPVGCLNIKTFYPGYWESHYKDKTVVRQSYLCNGNNYSGKMILSYWISLLFLFKTDNINMRTVTSIKVSGYEYNNKMISILDYVSVTWMIHDIPLQLYHMNVIVSNHWNWVFCSTAFETNKEGNIKTPHHWQFARGIRHQLLDSPHKGPVMKKIFYMWWHHGERTTSWGNDILSEYLTGPTLHAELISLSRDWMAVTIVRVNGHGSLILSGWC